MLLIFGGAQFTLGGGGGGGGGWLCVVIINFSDKWRKLEHGHKNLIAVYTTPNGWCLCFFFGS